MTFWTGARLHPIRAPRGHGAPEKIEDPLSWEAGFLSRLQSPDLRWAAAKFRGLQGESDASLRAAGLIELARELERRRRPELAALLYAQIQTAAPAPLAARAGRSLEILSGGGKISDRLELQIRHFTEHVLDPSSLIAMGLAGGVYRWVRLAALGRLSGVPLARLWASLAGLSAEVPAFAFGTRAGRILLRQTPEGGFAPLPQELGAAALFLGSLKLTGALAASAGRRIPADSGAARLSAGLLPRAALFGGIALGHRLEIAAGLRPERTSGAGLAEDLGTFFQLQVAGALSRGLMGRSWQSFEAGLELRAQQGPLPPALGPKTAFALAGPSALPPPRLGETEKLKGLSFMEGREFTPPPQRIRELAAHYLRLFPPTAEGYFSAEILRAACRIPCSLPNFHERLVEALYHASNRGSMEQLYTVLAIEDVFIANALRRSTGSFDYALLQLQIGSAVAEDHPAARLQNFQRIFRALEGGFDRRAQHELILRLPYDENWAVPAQAVFPESFWTQHRDQAALFWGSYRHKDWEMLLNFAYLRSRGKPQLASEIIRTFGEGREKGFYLSVDIDAALDYARAHPMGMVVLRRLHDVFATRDVHAKLAEIANDPAPDSTPRRIEALRRAGVPEEGIAYQLTGSEHTGYLNDLRLARKLVSVFQEIAPYVGDRRLTERGKSRLVEAFWEFARSGRKLEAEDLFDFWRLAKDPRTDKYLRFGEPEVPADAEHTARQGDPLTEAYIRMLREGSVSVEILSMDRFREIDRQWGKTQGRSLALTLFGRKVGEPDRILIPELPPLDLSQAEGVNRAFNEIRNRVRFLVHEAEHVRHFRGLFFGAEAGSQPIRLAGISRTERLVSETMASLEELRWRVKYSDQDYLELSRILGLTPATYLRNLADQQYFAAENAAKALD